MLKGALIVGTVLVAFKASEMYWRRAGWLEIKSIEYSHDIPAALPDFLHLAAGQNILFLKVGSLEKAALDRFVELKSLSIRRTLRRSIAVSGRYRQAEARFISTGRELYVDEKGVLFPKMGPDRPDLPVLSGAAPDRSACVAALDGWKEKAPEFYSLVTELETDKLRSLRVKLKDGVAIEWGELEPERATDRAKNVMKLREHFAPLHAGATLRFVTDDRLVMDANWNQIQPIER